MAPPEAGGRSSIGQGAAKTASWLAILPVDSLTPPPADSLTPPPADSLTPPPADSRADPPEPATRSAAVPVSDAALDTPDGFARFVFRAMGTDVTVVLPAGDLAEAALVEDLFATWELALSRFRPESELSRINASAGAVTHISRLMVEVVDSALRAARATGGLFDPTLEPQMRALGYDRTFDDVAANAPGQPVAVPGGAWRAIEFDRDAGTIRLPVGAALDLGGIAKGMAVDASIAELVRHGVAAAVVDAGGDLAVTGLPPGSAAWPVALELPGGHREVAIRSGALATSGVSRRRWRRGGVEQHHLVDPRTGEPARHDVWSVTASATNCAQAEVAAKVAFLLGRSEGTRFLLRHGISALLVDREGGQTTVGLWGDGGRSSDRDPSFPHAL